MKSASLLRHLGIALAAVVSLGWPPPSAFGQSLEMTLSTSAIAFASADPDTVPSIAAAPVIVRYRVRDNDAGSWRITLIAHGDLTSGAAVIPSSLVTWRATPAPPFQNGMMSSTVAQTLAAATGSQLNYRTGNVVFSLENRWTHNTGIYTTSITFTLIAP